MVTLPFIQSLMTSAQYFPEAERDVIEQDLLSILTNGLPNWDFQADTILRRSLPLQSEGLAVQINTNRAVLLESLLAYATGPQLDVLGLGPPPVLRRSGESDDSYRLRITNAHSLLNLGSLNGIQEQALAFNDEIIDAYAVISPNRQDPRVYTLKADVTQLTPEESMALTTYFAGRSEHIGGVVITVAQPTVKEYRIQVDAQYDTTRYGGPFVEGRIRESLYQFIRSNQLIARTLYTAALCDAAYTVETLNIPTGQFLIPTTGNTFAEDDDGVPATGDLLARHGFAVSDIYHCLQDEENVLITVNPVNPLG